MTVDIKQIENLGYDVLDIGMAEGVFDPMDIVLSAEGEPIYLGTEDCFFETEEAFSGLNISGKADFVCGGERRYLLGTSVYRDSDVAHSPIFRNNSWIDKKISAVFNKVSGLAERFTSLGVSVLADVDRVVEGVSAIFDPPPPTLPEYDVFLGDVIEDRKRRPSLTIDTLDSVGERIDFGGILDDDNGLDDFIGRELNRKGVELRVAPRVPLRVYEDDPSKRYRGYRGSGPRY